MQKENLILLHGALGSKKQFEALKPHLEENFIIHHLNFEGHGGVPSNRDFSIDAFTENLLDFIENKRLDRVAIFGYSMGGYVALNLALKHPNTVSKIITLGTKFDWTEASAAKEVKMLNPEKILEKVPQFAKKLEAEHAPNDWKNIMRKTADMMLELGNGKALKPSDLKQIKIPVRVGIGSEDNMVSIAESESAAKNLAQGKLKILQKAVHPIDKIETEELGKFIREFMPN